MIQTRRPVPATLLGDGEPVPCLDGTDRPYLSLDAAASTAAFPAVADAVAAFVPLYSSVHRGAGYRSRTSTAAYEHARQRALEFAGRDPNRDVAIICRNTTEAINHLAYRLQLRPADVVVTTVVEHHANLLPWARLCQRQYIDCGPDGTFSVDDAIAAFDAAGPRPALLAITGASNVTGWSPDLARIIPAAHERGIPVLVDAAQLAAHRVLPADADYLAWSGHKMYAPYGAGILIGPRSTFDHGDPFLAGGGAVDLVDLDEVVWTEPPDREEAGSPNVIGAVALGTAIDELERIGWDAIASHDQSLAAELHQGLAAIAGVRILGPADPMLPLATFTLEGVPHSLLAARLSAEHGIGVRHGCFCAHPYILRLLGLTAAEIRGYKEAVIAGDRTQIPGAVRASSSIATTSADIERFVAAVGDIVAHPEPSVPYEQDAATGDYWPTTDTAGWRAEDQHRSAPCGRG